VAGRPLRPATDRSLGEPLPHQLANQTQAPPQAHCCFNNCLDVEPLHYAVLANLSTGYSPPEGRLPTRYSPGRHSTHSRRNFRVRLACVRHAASVDSEPGSNSQSKILLIQPSISYSPHFRNIFVIISKPDQISIEVLDDISSVGLSRQNSQGFDVITLCLVFKYRSKMFTLEICLRLRTKPNYI
jgi:hypothetical protein